MTHCIARKTNQLQIAFNLILGFLVTARISATEVNDSSTSKWNSFDTALKQSKETGRPIMVVFSGSDWCNWCLRLKQEVFKTSEFATWANENVILVEADFPQMSAQPAEIVAQNQKLMEQFGGFVQTYPTVLFLDSDQRVIGQLGFIDGGPQSWISQVRNLLAADGKLATR